MSHSAPRTSVDYRGRACYYGRAGYGKDVFSRERFNHFCGRVLCQKVWRMMIVVLHEDNQGVAWFHLNPSPQALVTARP